MTPIPNPSLGFAKYTIAQEDRPISSQPSKIRVATSRVLARVGMSHKPKTP
jgi:hypothetical protein